MKYTVLLLLLVAIGHAADTSRRRGEDDNSSAKRELQEGNYGLRIQPAGFGTELPTPKPAFQSSRQNGDQKQTQVQEYNPLGAPVSKISDVLTGQGPSFSAAIASHLYSPVSIYQQKLGSSMTFEISPPVPSQLAYSEHNIFNPFQQSFENQKLQSLRLPQPQQFQSNQQLNNKFHENLKNRLFNSDQKLIVTEEKRYGPQEILQNQNFVQNADAIRQANAEESRQREQENLRQINLQNIEAAQKFEAQKQQQQNQQQQQLKQQQEDQSLQVSLLPSVPELQSPRRPIGITDQFLPKLESFQPQTRPIYSQQIFRQVFPQVQQIQGFPQDFFQQINQLGNQLSANDEALQYSQGSDEAKVEAHKQEEKPKIDQNAQQGFEGQTSTASPQSSTNQNQNADPALSYARFSQGLLPPNQIPVQPQQFLQFFPTPLPSPFPQFQDLVLPQSPQVFQAPRQPLVQVIEQIEPQPSLQAVLQPLQPTVQQFTSAASLQKFSTPPNLPQRVSITRDGTQPRPQPTFTTLNSQPTFASSEFNGLTMEVASSTVSTTVAPRSSSSSPENRFTTPLSVTIAPKFVSTLTSRLATRPPPPLPTSTPLVQVTTSSLPSLPPSTFATQSSTEATFSTILTSTEAPLTPIIHPLPTEVPVQTPEPQPIEVLSTEHQVRPTLPPLQVLSSSQALPAQQTYPAPQLPQQDTSGVRAIPVQRFQIQSELQPLFQVQNFEQQPLQLVPLQPVPLEITPTPSPQISPQILQLIPIQPQFDYRLQSHYQSEPHKQLQQLQQLSQQHSQQQQSQQQQYQQQQPLQIHQSQQLQLQQQPLQQQQFKQQQVQQQQYQQQQQLQQQPLQQLQAQQQQQAQDQQLQQPQQSQQHSQQPQQSQKEAIAHAQEVLSNIYSPFLRKPLYTESEEFVIQHPHFGAPSLPFPSPYSPTPLYPVHPSPVYPAIQYFGKYAKNIFAEPNYHHLKKK